MNLTNRRAASSSHGWFARSPCESTPFARIPKSSCAIPDTSDVLLGPRGCLETVYKVSILRVSGWDGETHQPLTGTSCESGAVFAVRTASPALSRRSLMSAVPANIASSAHKSRKATRFQGILRSRCLSREFQSGRARLLTQAACYRAHGDA